MLRPRDTPPWSALADQQNGAATRAQLLGAGVSPGVLRGLVDSGRFQKLYRGVFATFSGPQQAVQVVLRGTAFEDTQVRWRLERTKPADVGQR